MRITLAQLNYHIGHFEHNLRLMEQAIAQARAEHSDLIVFGELAVCGYPPRDFLEFNDFIRLCEQSIEALLPHSHHIAIAVGAPCRNPRPEGKDLFNAAYWLHAGRVVHIQHKALLPTYDVFDEYRYFEPGTNFQVVPYLDERIALTVCEDIWNVGNDNPLYTVCPLDEMQAQQPTLIVNLSASPFSYAQSAERVRICQANVQRYGLPLLYVNHVGAQTELIFDGGSLVISPDGQVFDEMPYFESCIRTYSLPQIRTGGQHQPQPRHKTSLIYQALVLGIRDYFQKLRINDAILGLSGGIDSAVVACLATEALGPQHVRVLLMPSQHSSDHSVRDARQLAYNLGIQHDLIPIEPMYQAVVSALSTQFWATSASIAEENIQARLRGLLLMSMSNKLGHILLNTTNKSEAAVGYGTLYGDLCGGLSVLGDVYKTEVYDLAHYINRKAEIIPVSSITKPPSAELRPDQKDSDSLPPYEVLDPLLFRYIEQRQGPDELVAAGFEPTLVQRVLRMVNTNEFKRYQTPPILRISPKAFGMGRRLPIVGKYLG